MASPTHWTWIWVSSGSWWWTGRPGVLQSMGSQRVGHDWATERQQQIAPNSKVNVYHSQFSAHTVPLTHTPRPRFHPAVNSLLKCSVSGHWEPLTPPCLFLPLSARAVTGTARPPGGKTPGSQAARVSPPPFPFRANQELWWAWPLAPHLRVKRRAARHRGGCACRIPWWGRGWSAPGCCFCCSWCWCSERCGSLPAPTLGTAPTLRAIPRTGLVWTPGRCRPGSMKPNSGCSCTGACSRCPPGAASGSGGTGRARSCHSTRASWKRTTRRISATPTSGQGSRRASSTPTAGLTSSRPLGPSEWRRRGSGRGLTLERREGLKLVGIGRGGGGEEARRFAGSHRCPCDLRCRGYSVLPPEGCRIVCVTPDLKLEN